jgi:hypothetical protein
MRLDSPRDLHSRKCDRSSRKRQQSARAAASSALSATPIAKDVTWHAPASTAVLSPRNGSEWNVDIEMEWVSPVSDVKQTLFSLMFGKLIDQVLSEPE